MVDAQWEFGSGDGDLLLGTGVAGRAAKMGHRLTIAMDTWQAVVSWAGDRPAAVRVTVEVDSFAVRRGEGGLTPLSPPEKTLIRVNALKCLDSARYPRIRFDCSDVAPIDGGYRLAGTLEIHGREHPHTVDVRVTDLGDSWELRCDTAVLHSDYRVKRYSMLMGSMQVADEVTVSWRAVRAKDGR